MMITYSFNSGIDGTSNANDISYHDGDILGYDSGIYCSIGYCLIRILMVFGNLHEDAPKDTGAVHANYYQQWVKMKITAAKYHSTKRRDVRTVGMFIGGPVGTHCHWFSSYRNRWIITRSVRGVFPMV